MNSTFRQAKSASRRQDRDPVGLFTQEALLSSGPEELIHIEIGCPDAPKPHGAVQDQVPHFENSPGV
jgi:hypothetical protein